MNKNIKGLKTYIIRKKKKNSLVSVVWKKFKIKMGKSALSKWRLPGVLGKSQTKESATKDELVFFFLILLSGPQMQQKRIKKLPRAYYTESKGSKNLT